MTDRPELKDFESALANWVETAVEHMRPALSRYVMCEPNQAWRLDPDGFYRRPTVNRCYWNLNGFPDAAVKEEIQSLPSYQKLLSVARKTAPLDGMFDNLVGTVSGQSTFDFFIVIAIRALPPAATVVAGEPYSVGELCRATVDRILADEIDLSTVSFLDGISLACDRLELEPGLTIERLTSADVVAGLRLGFLSPDSNDFPVFQPGEQKSFGLKRRWRTPRVVGETTKSQVAEMKKQDAAIRSAGDRLLESMALLTDQRINITGEVTPHVGRETLTPGDGFSYRPFPATRVWTNYRLDGALCQQLQELWRRPSQNSRQGRSLDLAIRRLSFAIQRERWDDRLLDLFVGAEAFYLTDVGDAKDKGELKYRLALRAAVWSEDSVPGWTRREVFQHMKRGYDLRSAIVHGSTPDPKDVKVKGERVELKVFVAATEAILRAAIYKAVKLSAEGRRLTIPWDDMILPD